MTGFPTISTVVSSACTQPASLILPPAQAGQHLIISPSGITSDAFSKAQPNAGRDIIEGSGGGGKKSVVHLKTIARHVEAARSARTNGDLQAALDSYTQARRGLESPAPGQPDAVPLYSQLRDGHNLYAEALFETSLLSSADAAPENLRRLYRFEKQGTELTHNPTLTRARAKMLEAFSLMQHTGSTFERQAVVFHRGSQIIKCVMDDVESQADFIDDELLEKTSRLYAAFEKSSREGSDFSFRRSLAKLEKSLKKIDAASSAKSKKKSKPDVKKTQFHKKFMDGLMFMKLGFLAASPQRSLYRKALEHLDQALEFSEYDDSAEAADLRLSIDLLKVELKGRQLTLACGRKDYGTRDSLVRNISTMLESIKREHVTSEACGEERPPESLLTHDDKIKIIASYYADVAILFARLGIWSPALTMGQAALSGPFKDTPSARRLLNHEIFEPFVRGHNILSWGNVAEHSRRGRLLRRFRAAIKEQHTKSTVEAIVFGGIGMAPGLAEFLVNDTRTGWFCIAGVVGANIFNRLWNGWMSGGAQRAALTDTYDRSEKETFKDIGRLAAHSALDTVPWIVPAAMVNIHDQALELLQNIFSNSAAAAWHNISDGIGSIADPDTYRPLLHYASSVENYDAQAATALLYDAAAGVLPALFAWSVFSPHARKLLSDWRVQLSAAAPSIAALAMNLGEAPHYDLLDASLYHGYTYGAALMFAAQFIKHKDDEQKKYINRLSGAFFPGVWMLSADIGVAMVGGPDAPTYESRLLRAGILSLETYVLMHVQGNVNWEWNHEKKAHRNLWEFAKATYMATPQLPLAVVMTNAVTAPLGGYIQKDKSLIDPVLIAIQGVCITTCILPITLGVSGILKRQIPLGERIRQGWQDARDGGEDFWGKLREAAMGAASAFHTPYAHNRIFRIPTYDILPAGFRAALGWDTTLGQTAMSAVNIVHGSPTVARTWPDLSGTKWCREVIVKEFAKAKIDFSSIDERERSGVLSSVISDIQRKVVCARIRSFLQKAGQVMHGSHIFMPHQSLADRTLPFYAVATMTHPPRFPQMPNRHFYADLFLMLTDRHEEKLDEGSLRALLSYVEHDAADPSSYDTIRPLVQTLALARMESDRAGGGDTESKDISKTDNDKDNSKHFREIIDGFFDRNPQIPVMLDADLHMLTPISSAYRRNARSRVRDEVKMRFPNYDQRVAGYRGQPKKDNALKGLFELP